MKNNLLKYLLLSCTIMALFSSCRKDAYMGTETGSKGTSFVSLSTMENKIFFSPFTDIRTVNVLTMRRSAANSADLSKAVDVTLKYLPGAIDKYNENNETDYEELPASIFTFTTDKGVTKTNDGFTFSFASGDFQKNVSINLDGSKYDLSKKYALAYEITDPGSLTVKSNSKDTAYVLISIKNKYDAIYEVTGSCTDANGLYKGDYGDPDYPRILSLSTASSNTVSWYDVGNDYGNYLVLNNAGTSYANTGFAPFITFDPATDAVTSVINANTGAAFTSVSGQFNAADRSLDLQYTNGRWTVKEHYAFSEER